MRSRRWSVPLFDFGEVMFSTDRKEVERVVIRCGGDAMLVSDTALGQSFALPWRGRHLFLIGVYDGNPATVAHECAHAAFYICDAAHVRVDTALANETFCYLLSHLVARCLATRS